MRAHDKSYVTTYNPHDPAVIRAVAALKDRVAKAVTLKPVDWKRPMHIHTDAAQSKGIGMVLSQWYDEDELPMQDNNEQKLPEHTPPGRSAPSSGNVCLQLWNQDLTYPKNTSCHPPARSASSSGCSTAFDLIVDSGLLYRWE